MGGPVTVTHPEISRYFMTIPEAVGLILQAGGMGKGGEIFVLDMGEPVFIRDLARQMIRLSGMTQKSEIEIIYTGLRPGEKMSEELFHTSEELKHTSHPKLLLAKSTLTLNPTQFLDELEQLHGAALSHDGEKIVRHLERIVPGLHLRPESIGNDSLRC
jgi:FlaA1/EpsC-like NDP-sugar epimerase